MKQVVQSASGGPVRVLDVPRPVNSPTEVLVRTVASLMSPGTERAVTALARSNLLAKARARPDLVRQVVKKARNEGVLQAARAVSTRLHDDIPLGYSAAGIAIEVGEAVAGIAPGQLVATGGAGKANHAEFQAVPGLLCAPVPDGVPASDAAFATIASVALHGFRLAEVGPGAKVVVLGLGLVGQLGVRLAQAAGCDVAAIDLGEAAVERARAVGCIRAGGGGCRHHQGHRGVVAGEGRRRGAGDGRHQVVVGDRPHPGAVPRRGQRGRRGRHRPRARPPPVLRAGADDALRPVLRARALRAELRGLGRRLPPRPGPLERGPQHGGGARPAGVGPPGGRRPGHPPLPHRRRPGRI